MLAGLALIVEADLRVRARIAASLPRSVRVFAAQDAEDAMESFARAHPRRVFLGSTTDADDPRVELLREMTELDPHARVAVVLREDDADALARSALRAGAFAVVTSDERALRRAVREMADEERASRPT